MDDERFNNLVHALQDGVAVTSKELGDEIYRMVASLAEKDAQLCRAREALERSVDTCFSEYAHRDFMSDPNHFVHAALSSTGPCQHEARVKELEEAVDEMERAYPLDIFSDPGPDDLAYLHTGPHGMSERLHGSWARHLMAELRRRAGA